MILGRMGIVGKVRGSLLRTGQWRLLLACKCSGDHSGMGTEAKGSALLFSFSSMS